MADNDNSSDVDLESSSNNNSLGEQIEVDDTNSSYLEEKNNNNYEDRVNDDDAEDDDYAEDNDHQQQHTKASEKNLTHSKETFVSEHNMYIPSFTLDLAQNLSEDEYKKIKEDWSQRNWLTPGLLKELEESYPAPHHIDKNNANKRDKEAFEECMSKVFYEGRKFASPKQLHQAVCNVGKRWAFEAVVYGKHIGCSFGKQVRKYDRIPDKEKQRKTKESLKNQYKCPFRIQFSLVNYSTIGVKKPIIFFQVKITKCIFEHTCTMDTTAHRVAIQKCGRTVPDHILPCLQTVIDAVANDPDIEIESLRAVAERFLPSYCFADAKFLDNLKKRIENHILTNGIRAELSEKAANKILKQSRYSAAEELLNFEDPLIKTNLADLLRNSLSNTGSGWQALKVLEDFKALNPLFTYEVLKDDKTGCPIAVIFMDEEMRYNLLRFGHLCSADANQTKFNAVSWCLITPTGRDNENRIIPFAKCLSFAESREAYVFAIGALERLEPRYKLQNMKIIFGDKFITQDLLSILGIENTCVLQCDYCHMLEEVTKEQFGELLHSKIRDDLIQMFKGPKSLWESSYHNILNQLQGDAEHIQSLQKLFNNPKYYAGWYLRRIELNINIKGTQSSESYHGTIKKSFKKNRKWSIATNIAKLYRPHKNWKNRLHQKDSTYYCETKVYNN